MSKLGAVPFITASLSNVEAARTGAGVPAPQGFFGPGLAFVYQLVKSTAGGTAVSGASVAFTYHLSAIVHVCGGEPQPPDTSPLVSFAAAVPTVALLPLSVSVPPTRTSTGWPPLAVLSTIFAFVPLKQRSPVT
jgi:hypothetical protein